MGEPIVINGNLGQFPVGNDYSTPASLLDYARGVGAGFVGQPYDVYRVTSASNGDYIQDANKVYSNFPLSRKRLKKGYFGAETAETQGTYLYSMFGDLSDMQAGDIYVQNDPAYGIGQTLSPFASGTGLATQFNGIAEASHAPIRKSIGARVDRMVTVYRMPNTDVNGYNVTRQNKAQPLQCIAGVWTLNTDPTQPAATIPAGFMTIARIREPMYRQDPNATGSTSWMIYIPLLNGFQILEGDRIQSYDGSRYLVVHPYEQESGVMGHQLICQREVI